MQKPKVYPLPQTSPQTKKKGPKIHYTIIMLLSVISLYFFFQSPFFEIKRIYVTGTDQITIDQVLELSSIQPGVSIFKVNQKQIAKKLSAHPWVKEVVVERKLPSTVKIMVLEREGVAIVPAEEGYLIIDETGIVLKKNQHLSQIVLPLITSVTIENIPYGEKITSDEVLHAVTIVHLLPEVIQSRVAEIAVDEGITFFATGGMEIKMGTAEEFERKLQILTDIFNNTDEEILKKIIYIDLRFNGPPIIRYSG